MYKSHSIWDEEQERQEKYAHIGAEKGGPDYHNQGDYNSGGENQSDAYNAGKGGEDKKKDEEARGIEKSVADQEKKYEKKEATEEDIKKKAASEVHQGSKTDDGDKKKKKEHKSIEDAINKAMKEEKEVIYVDD